MDVFNGEYIHAEITLLARLKLILQTDVMYFIKEF